MKAARMIYVLVLFVIPISCFVTREGKTDGDSINTDVLETQYYKLFTDATKHALFGNYKNAVQLYKACINMYPDRAAPYYQISTIYLMNEEVEIAMKFAETAVEKDSLNPWYLSRLAEVYLYFDLIDKTIGLYEQMLTIKDDDEIRYNLSMLYNRVGRNEEALRILNFMEEENRESREVILMRHNLFHELRRYDSAVYELELITKYFPEDISGYGMLAEYLSEIGRNNYAKNVYYEILKKDPGNGIAVLSFGEFFLKNNASDSAFYYFKKAFCCTDLTLNDKISVVVSYINDDDFIKKNYVLVEELLDEIPGKDRKFAYYAAKADIYIKLEQYESAKPFLDSALLYEKTNFMLWEQSLIINSYLSYESDVISIATECLEYFNDRPNVLFFRANAFFNLNQNEKALSDLENIFDGNTTKGLEIQAYNLAAEIYRRIGEDEKSDSCFESLLEIDPENLMIRNNYAYYLSLRGVNLKRAEELSKLTIEREPDNATYLDTYGWVLYRMKEYKHAKSYVESAIRNGAYNNAEVLEHYGDIMMDLNSCGEALEAYEKAKEVQESELLIRKIEELQKKCQQNNL